MAYRPPGSRKVAPNQSKPNSGLQLSRKSTKPTSQVAPQFDNDDAFPSLGSASAYTENTRLLDFASVTNKDDNDSNIDEIASSSIPSGWVCLRSSDPRTINKRSQSEMSDIPSPRTTRHIVDGMVRRWEDERASMNELLGDMSPYWNALPIGECSDDDDD